MFADIHQFTVLAQGGATPVPIYFGAAHIVNGVSTHLGDNFDYPQGFDAAEGMYSTKGIDAFWSDTTAMDNITSTGLETISPNVTHTYSSNPTSY